jgi:hypothetical protein
MSKKEKLIDRFLRMPSDFHYDEMVKLLGYFGFNEEKKRKTSGLRVNLENLAMNSLYLESVLRSNLENPQNSTRILV